MPRINTIDELTATIAAGENQRIEFKADISDDRKKFLKTVVAFANGAGGTILFGVDDKTHSIIGFSSQTVYAKIDAITNSIIDNCYPIVPMSIRCLSIEEKNLIIVNIGEGERKPYCYRPEGERDGVYIRYAGTTRKAADYQVRSLYMEQSRSSYDQTATTRILSDEEINRLCQRLRQHAIALAPSDKDAEAVRPIGKSQLIACRIVNVIENQCHASVGYQLLDGALDDYPDARICCALFKGNTRDIFIDRKIFSGPVDEQVESAFTFVLQHIKHGARMEGLTRQDIWELPIKSIREIITNAVCHRSYLAPGPIFVNLYDDRLEVSSPGLLSPSLTIEDIIQGQSLIQNPGIANVFAYMHMIESWGSGIPRLFTQAKDYGLSTPKLSERGTNFIVELFRKPFSSDQLGVLPPTPLHEQRFGSGMTAQQAAVLQHFMTNPETTIAAVAEAIDCSEKTVKRLIQQLKASGRLKREGSTRFGRWIVTQKSAAR